MLGFLGKKTSEIVILATEMSNKCLVLIICVAFVGVTLYTFILASECFPEESTSPTRHSTLNFPTFLPDKVHCNLKHEEFLAPSLEDVIHALGSKENPGISSISGLALYFNLNNACQPLDDVTKASVQVYKFALVTLVDETACPLQRLALNAQNTGYAVLVHFFVTGYLDTHNKYKLINLPKTIPSEEKVVIPVATVGMCLIEWAMRGFTSGSLLSKADRTIVEITVPLDRNELILKKMEGYLKYLFLWSLVGPLVYFVVWMRSSGRKPNQQLGNGVETAAETETRIMEEGELNMIEHRQLHSLATEETVTNTHTENEMQPLLNGVRCGSNTRQRQRRCIIIGKCFCKILVGLCYLILIIAALPVGISTGGLSFFRFDQGDNSFPGDQYFFHPFEFPSEERKVSSMGNKTVVADSVTFSLTGFVALWWSPFQLFCFFLYSYFARKATWTVSTNFPKVIRSDWFSSNIYLLVLAVIVPYSQPHPQFFSLYFATNNVLCTVCNVLFIVILDKHKAVTRYILFLSVCVICAYLESDIVALVYYILNSTGSLVDVKLTALRTAAISYTLSVSLSLFSKDSQKNNEKLQSASRGREQLLFSREAA